MSEENEIERGANLQDIVEKIRAERFPDVSRDLMLEILRLHAEADRPENLNRKVDEALATAAKEQI